MIREMFSHSSNDEWVNRADVNPTFFTKDLLLISSPTYIVHTRVFHSDSLFDLKTNSNVTNMNFIVNFQILAYENHII